MELYIAYGLLALILAFRFFLDELLLGDSIDPYSRRTSKIFERFIVGSLPILIVLMIFLLGGLAIARQNGVSVHNEMLAILRHGSLMALVFISPAIGRKFAKTLLMALVNRHHRKLAGIKSNADTAN